MDLFSGITRFYADWEKSEWFQKTLISKLHTIMAFSLTFNLHGNTKGVSFIKFNVNSETVVVLYDT